MDEPPLPVGARARQDEAADDSDWEAIARTLSTIGNLKRTPRTGWLDRGVPELATESVADHSFRVALLSWMVATTYPRASQDEVGIDLGRVLLIALAHDLPEAFAGDPTPYAPEDVPPESDPDERRRFLEQRQERDPARAAGKRRAEQAAMTRLLVGLPTAMAESLGDAWREYEDQATPEARLVKQADRLETYLQSREYLADDPNLPIGSFARQVEDPATLPDDAMRDLRDAIERTTEMLIEGPGRKNT